VAVGDLLLAADKSGQWARWYRKAIPQAEQLYATLQIIVDFGDEQLKLA
jgi:hypothetical protein